MMPTQGYGNLDGWFDALSSSRPVPAVGAATALSAAMAASVLAKVARRSRDHMADAADHVADAEHLRDSLLALAQEDGPSFRRAMTLSHAGDPNAMSIASAVPWRVAVVSADVGVLGVNPNLYHDAHGAATLAASCARVAADLVRANLGRGSAVDTSARVARHAADLVKE